MEIILLTIGLVSLAVATVAKTKFLPDDTQIRVMSYKIRYDNSDDGVNRWDERVANLIRFHAPGILCLQEALNTQITWLENYLDNYA